MHILAIAPSVDSSGFSDLGTCTSASVELGCREQRPLVSHSPNAESVSSFGAHSEAVSTLET